MKPRQIRIEGNLAYVPLTKGYEAVIDAADAQFVGGWNWFAKVKSRTVYVRRNDFSSGRQITVLLHRVLMDAQDGQDIDHRDGNGLNNQRINLRIATKSQNMHNQRLRSDNVSGFKGVYWNKAERKWAAAIKLHGKQRHLGCFQTPELASAAREAASTELHGEFGRAA